MSSPLRVLRETLDLTQAELAEELGITRGRVCQIERGGGRLGSDNLLRLFDRYRVEIARLGFTHEDFLRGKIPRTAA